MSLVRAAFECEDGIVQIVVLCTGCYAEMIGRLEEPRRWSRPIDCGVCEFCATEVRDAVTRR